MKITVRKGLWFGMMLAMTVVSYAQPILSTKNKKAIELYTEADNFRVRGEYGQALNMLNEALQKDKNFSEAYFRIALIFKTQRHYDKAISYYHQGLALNTDVKKQKAYFLELGEVYQFVGDYEKSLQFLNRYLDNEIMNKRNIELATHLKRNSVFALKNQKVVTDFRPKELSDTVNAFPMQYFPVLTADEQELIFTRRLGGRDTDDEDLVVVKKNNEGRWGRPFSVSDAINSRLNEGTCTISADGRQLIFTSCAGRRGYGSCDLFESRKNGDTWTTPVNLGPQVNSAAWESQPSLSADGNMLFFVSDRRGGLGNKDIYVSYKLNNNQWTRAENLGDKINTPYEEISPFIHVNGRTLFFASNGRPGFGGFDLYRSERENSLWSEPVNFGSPVNTHEDQFSLYITADGKRGFYSHEDNDKINSSKIVEITIPEDLRLRYVSNYVKGVVLDKKTRKPLKAKVELFNINQNVLTSSVYSDSITGEYLMVLTQGAEYALYVNSPRYLFQSLNFNYESEIHHDPVALDILLDPAELGASAVLHNIFFEFNKFDIQEKSTTELDKVVRFMNENPGLRVEISGHTDNAGTAAYNLQLSQKRSHAVAQYLIDHGVELSRLEQKGYGSGKPIKPNDTEENRQINRRIEFRIIR